MSTTKDVEANPEPLRDYEHLKFELASLGRAARAAVPTPRDARIEQEYQSFMGRLADDQFNLAVVGHFNRGKTSLMNAVLGVDRLPTGIMPLTSVITVVRYGSHESALVEYENLGLRKEISLADLPAYVTQEGNPGNEKHIRTVEVQLPAEILRRGFRFVDTPGLGSAIAANTITTDRYLPEADAIVFVTSSDAPLSEAEIRYLHDACRLVRKVFLVINKIDLLSSQDQKRVRDFVCGRLAQERLAELPLYALSARDGLRAKLDGQTALLNASGLLQFEQDLVHFVVTEKSRDFLAQNCDRLMRIAMESGSTPELISRIAELRARVLGLDPARARHDAVELAKAAGVRRFCPVCHAAAQAVRDFLSKYQYEISHSPEEQHKHAANHGFCSLHSWQYEQLASPRGVCSAYPPLLQTIAGELLQASSAAEMSSVGDPFEAVGKHCPACQVQSQAVEAVLKGLADSINEFSGVVCLPHLRLLLPRLDGTTARSLVARHAQVLQRVADDMQRFVIKQDGFRRDLISQEERQSHQQGLALIVGDRRLVLPSDTEVWL